MENLAIGYPLWAILLCPTIGLVYALILYYQNRRNQSFGQTLVWALGIGRFLLVTGLCFLLLKPFLTYLDIEIEPPIVVVAVDESQSMVLGPDSAQVKADVRESLSLLNRELGTEFELAVYGFGQEVRNQVDSSYADPVTDFSDLFSSLSGLYANRNLGAVVVISDGIYNRGRNPRYAVDQLATPVYTIGTGDTIPRRDLKIAEVAANRIAFLGNQFPIEATIRARKCEGENANYRLVGPGGTIEEGVLPINSDEFEATVRFLVDASEIGLQAYRVEVSGVSNEITNSNNAQTVFVDVIDSRQKISIVAKAPHPDLAAIRNAIATNENYEVEIIFESDLKKGSESPDLWILHQVPNRNTSQDWIQIWASGKTPIWLFGGIDSDITNWARLGAGVRLSGGNGSWNDVGGLLLSGFNAFKVDTEIKSLLADAPPVKVPFGKWMTSGGTQVLLDQKVGQIETGDPLLTFSENTNHKTAVFIGEGIWRWRLFNFAMSENHQLFDGMVSGIVQYLSLKEDKRLFRVFGPSELMENEHVVFNAELYNDAYQPINDEEVELRIVDADGVEYPFNFSRTGSAYRLDAGVLPVGSYTYQGKVVKNGEVLTDGGKFAILPFALEGGNLTANHRLLYQVSERSGGAFYTSAGTSDLIANLKAESKLAPRSFSTERRSSVLDFKWIFFVLLGIMTLEWIARKWAGGY